MDLPEVFISNMRGAFKGEGEKFLADLPALIGGAARRWQLTDIRPVENLSFNFVASARRAGQDVILKLGVPQDELSSEIAALRLYGGVGACRLLESDAEAGLLLLERLKPGRMLAELPDDEQATAIAARVMRQLWRPAPQGGPLDEARDAPFIQLRKWFEGLDEFRVRLQAAGAESARLRLLEKAEGLVRELFAEAGPDVLLHGDFHHYNVLESERGWLIIDPKGVIGPAGYDCGPFQINPFDLLERPDPVRVAARRIAILAEALDFEREYVQAWGFAHAVLSAWWSIEDEDPGGWRFHSLNCAEVIEAAPI